jgi:rare lipoprotein A (peptidoglycan hydrolase)
MRNFVKKILTLGLALGVFSFSALPQAYAVQEPRAHKSLATWYNAPKGAKTANGEAFNASEMTAAHPSLPMGTILRVTRASNQKTVFVRINDRCRCSLDLTKGAAERIDLVRDGRDRVSFEIYSPHDKKAMELSSLAGDRLYPSFAEDTAVWRIIY